ncbi:hypothetical protein N7494_013188 [Penicillium frequentans]|uniref:Uncharacterized protein n=1 Tax=Penicillium frequentans TaxID=3151616 RepID=A0AAD6G841_9EURO|nr:hypothetical protein N7494_013188 [Penicillium glabrum]
MTSYRHPYCETDSGSASAAAARLPYNDSIPGFDLKAGNRFNFGALEPFSAKTEPFSIPISTHDTFWYLSGRSDNTLDEYDADGSTGYGNDSGVLTPSTTTDTNTLPLDDEHAADMGPPGWAASNVTLHHSVGTPLSPEPTVLLTELQKAAEDVSQIVGRFGFKMASQLQQFRCKEALFANRKHLQLPSLRYADSFTCRLTKIFQKPVSLRGEAPLLWWLWDALLECSTPSVSSTGCTLDFTPTRRTDIILPCSISIQLCTRDGVDKIGLTAVYGGDFMERRIFDAPVARFHFPDPGFDKSTVALAIDQPPYSGDGSFKDALDYLMPRPASIWRSAMSIVPAEEKRLAHALAKTCKAKDDYMYNLSEENDSQCKRLIRRLPPVARQFIEDEGLVGKERGPYSKSANGPPGPKD